jgi:integrase
MALSNPACNNAKPKEKPYKLADEKGMFLLINPNGSKYFRLKYRFGGKEKVLALGVYPEISLKDARTKRDEAREQLSKGIDPSATRKAEKKGGTGTTLEEVAKEFIDAKRAEWSKSHHKRIDEVFSRDIFPWLGSRPIKDLSPLEVLETLQRISDRGALETAIRAKQFIGQVLRYGIATRRAERDVTADLKGALRSPTKGHFSAIIDPRELARLLRDVYDYEGSYQLRMALRFQTMTFARPGNLVEAEWSEIDLDAMEWRIPAHKMKMKDAHIIPLSRQAVEILRDIYPLTGSGRYVFSSNQGKAGSEPHICRESVGAALRRMGYKGEQTAHGFRTTASSLLHEQGFNSDAIERQLAHAERNKVKKAYNRAAHLPERRVMMQAWSDYLDSLRDGANVIAFRRSG